MTLLELLLTAIGLAMDAFAVSVCKGLSMDKATLKRAVIVGIWFGGFQALMPLIGYFVGTQFEGLLTAIDHWIAFALLGLIGANMIRESISGKDDKTNALLTIKVMLPMALATSIDALAVGVTYAFLKVNIFVAVAFIGVITFLLSATGVKIGNIFGAKLKSKAELLGGIILILMAIKILLEHLGIL
ncbi:MAG: manganese efflux pump [Clostridia bacterium]|nr:manganese efflux pump [Clostridia bacterium]